MSTEDPLRFLVRFIHLEKMLPPFPGVHETLLADLLKMDAQDLLRVRRQLAAEVATAAEELLGDETFARQVDRLPFAAGSTIVGLGDSVTDDLQSWLEILRQVLERRRPNDRITLVNAGASGEATPQIMSRLPLVLASKPQWVICLAGTNDARCFGPALGTTQVSLGETTRNLKFFTDFAARHSEARWLWITPVPVVEQRIVGHWFWTPMQTLWARRDIEAIGEAMLGLGNPVVDLRPVFAGEAGADLILDDGVHPTLLGQQEILKKLVVKLAVG